MAVLPIRIYPDPVLRRKCAAVEVFDGELARLADDMVETMIAAPGVGLAAPQVGIEKRLAVVDVSVGKDPDELLILVNPKIVESSGAEVDVEGCLSIPDLSERVERPERIRVTAQELDGSAKEVVADGFLARAICHEIDHLDGVLFIDHLRGLRRERVKRTLRKRAREAET